MRLHWSAYLGCVRLLTLLRSRIVIYNRGLGTFCRGTIKASFQLLIYGRTVLYNTLQFDAVQYNIIQYNSVHYTTIKCVQDLLRMRLLAWVSTFKGNNKERIRHPKEGHSDPHRADPHLPPSAPLRAAHTLPHAIGFHTALEGEYRRSVLREYSRQREGTRVKTANVRRYSSR